MPNLMNQSTPFNDLSKEWLWMKLDNFINPFNKYKKVQLQIYTNGGLFSDQRNDPISQIQLNLN